MSDLFLILHKDLQSLKDRLLAKTAKQEDGCWICFAGGVNSRYGTIWYNGSNISCHRASWLVHKGPIPEGLHVLHTCDVKGCIAPDHLFIDTEVDNMQDKHRKGRNDPRQGSLNPAAYLNEEKVREIKYFIEHSGLTQKRIAEHFGVTQSVISNIKNGITWNHV